MTYFVAIGVPIFFMAAVVIGFIQQASKFYQPIKEEEENEINSISKESN